MDERVLDLLTSYPNATSRWRYVSDARGYTHSILLVECDGIIVAMLTAQAAVQARDALERRWTT